MSTSASSEEFKVWQRSRVTCGPRTINQEGGECLPGSFSPKAKQFKRSLPCPAELRVCILRGFRIWRSMDDSQCYNSWRGTDSRVWGWFGKQYMCVWKLACFTKGEIYVQFFSYPSWIWPQKVAKKWMSPLEWKRFLLLSQGRSWEWGACPLQASSPFLFCNNNFLITPY